MDKKQSSQKTKNFFKKNAYYFIMAICLLAIVAMITVSVLINNGTINVNEDTPTITNPDGTLDNNPDQNQGTTNPDQNVEPEPDVGDGNENGEQQPTAIVFSSVTDTNNVILDYSMDALVWNSTLKHYAVHNGIDYGGNDGDNVYCPYDGVVTEVTYDILNGHCVTITHNENLVTEYRSLNTPSVSVGQTVKQGGIIATMGTSATNEYALGAHVHFSCIENGNYVNPSLYFAQSEDK